MGNVLLVEADAYPGLRSGPLHVEEVEAVGAPAARARNDDIIEDRSQIKTTEWDREGPAGGDEPAVRLNPGVRLLRLLVMDELLPEQAIVVVESNPVPRQPQGGDRVQKAGSQPAQAARCPERAPAP